MPGYFWRFTLLCSSFLHHLSVTSATGLAAGRCCCPRYWVLVSTIFSPLLRRPSGGCLSAVPSQASPERVSLRRQRISPMLARPKNVLQTSALWVSHSAWALLSARCWAAY